MFYRFDNWDLAKQRCVAGGMMFLAIFYGSKYYDGCDGEWRASIDTKPTQHNYMSRTQLSLHSNPLFLAIFSLSCKSIV